MRAHILGLKHGSLGSAGSGDRVLSVHKIARLRHFRLSKQLGILTKIRELKNKLVTCKHHNPLFSSTFFAEFNKCFTPRRTTSQQHNPV